MQGASAGPTIQMETRLLDALTLSTRTASISEAAALLGAGHLVAFPTETVYGLGASALDADAVRRVFDVKGRPPDNPLIVHVHEPEALASIAVLDDRARAIASAMMPGPITLVLPSQEHVPLIARAGLPTVAVRIPDHEVALDLLRAAGPLVGPSANKSGRPSPTTADHVLNDIDGLIAAVIDGGPCRVGIESTVLDLSGDEPVILRPGLIDAGAIERVLGVTIAYDEGGTHRSPGTRHQHYAPRVPVRLIIAEEPPVIDTRLPLVLTTKRHLDAFPRAVSRIVSEERLYALLRTADDVGFDEVIIYAQPGELSTGLLDRVTRASGARR